MAGPRRYPNAPITEALIDLRVKMPKGTTVEDLEKIHAAEKSAYPAKKQRRLVSGQMQIGEAVSASADVKDLGFVFTSKDKKQVFQARLDGFTMSRLAPYESWSVFCEEARRLWNQYCTVVKPEKIVRLAVRYINRLDLPLPVSELSDYLRTVPEISRDLPQGLAGYFLNLQIPMEDMKSTLLINETIIEPAEPNVVSIVLDIDLYQDCEVPQDEDGIWEAFERLRTRKNQVFESSITDRTRELFE